MAENNLRRKVLTDLKGIQKKSSEVRLIAKRLETLIRNGKVEPTKNTLLLVGHQRGYVIEAEKNLAKHTARLIANARK